MKSLARNLRKNGTEAENRVWYFLRNRRLNGLKFVRQKVIDNYIVDFVCREKTLIVEIDGSQHIELVEQDMFRTKVLECHGYRVLRVWNHEVFNNIDGVMSAILDLIENEPT